MVAAEFISVKEMLGAQPFGPGGEMKGVRVTDDRGQSLAADVRADGSVWVRVEGTGVFGTVDEVVPCHILVNRFNSGNDNGPNRTQGLGRSARTASTSWRTTFTVVRRCSSRSHASILTATSGLP